MQTIFRTLVGFICLLLSLACLGGILYLGTFAPAFSLIIVGFATVLFVSWLFGYWIYDEIAYSKAEQQRKSKFALYVKNKE